MLIDSINLHKLGSFILCHQTSCHKTSQTYEENRKILAFYTKYNWQQCLKDIFLPVVLFMATRMT